MQRLSTQRLFHAPHRLMFFIGAGNVLLAMLWWACWLLAMRMGHPFPQPQVPAGWLHAFIMQYQVLPSFFFGFLLTTFPKWTGLPEIPRRRFAPVGIGMMTGQIATLTAAVGVPHALEVGIVLTLFGWLAGLIALGSCLVREPGRTWHAYSCLGGLVLGFFGLLCWAAFVFSLTSPLAAIISIKIGTFGLLLPIYLTVAHRMFPFFASNAMKHTGYTVWRPMWLLVIIWPLILAHLAIELLGKAQYLWPIDGLLLLLSIWMLVKWWPRGKKPVILTVLFVGFAWIPVTFALYVLQSVALYTNGQLILDRAPAHSLFVGFFGSVLVAMVTRVSQGHSGRPLVMPPVAIYAFIAINLTAAVRITSDIVSDPLAWHVAAGLLWLIALTPWALRLGTIYLAPRVDGKAG